jgi:hypothetical protein
MGAAMTLSSWLHYLVFRDPRMSICGRAWDKREHRFWALWVKVFGKDHCRNSWLYHMLRD